MSKLPEWILVLEWIVEIGKFTLTASIIYLVLIIVDQIWKNKW